MFFYIIISLIFVLIILKFKKNKKNHGGFKEIPSAPGGLPIIGHLLRLGVRPYEYFTELSEKMGPIYKVQIGWKELIIINNNSIINKCLKEQGDNFSGRWRNTFTDQIAHFCGLVFKEKEWWAVQRSFSLRALKDFGFGKLQTETIIIKEMENIMNTIRVAGEKAISSADIVSLATVNVMSNFTMRKEFKEGDSEIVNLMRNIRKLAQGTEINMIIVTIFPIFKYFPKIEYALYKVFDKDNVSKTIERVYEFIGKFVEEHRKNFHPNNESQDLIDAFLFEQYKLKESNTKEHSFTDWQLIRLIAELFIVGFETTSTTLTWTFLILSKYPDIQKKMHEEVVSIIGTDRFPTMADKKSLHYFQAVMDEILRFVTLLPLSLPHRVFEDTSVDDYFIPGDSIILTNLFACHRDPKVWAKPYDFFPEHFLDKDGRYISRPELIPFGVGKRICLGESLAKMEYFIFLASIIQKFTLSLDDESDKKKDFQLLDGTGGTIRGPVEHKIKFIEILKDI